MTLHVIGAGLAGLACALAAADAGLDVTLHEATKQAGGRCRSLDDSVTGRRIDNGTHVVVGGNPAAYAYLCRIGSADTLRPLPPMPTVFDLASGETWRPGMIGLAGAVLGSLARLGLDSHGTVAGRLGQTRDYRRLWEPLTVAALNTAADLGSAALLRTVLKRTVWRGMGAARMHVVRDDLSATFIEPALAALKKAGVDVRLGHPLRAPAIHRGVIAELAFDDSTVALTDRDAVVIAVPWWSATRWLGLSDLPDSPIVNAHFRLAAPPTEIADHGTLGLIGGTAQWVFRRGDILAITVSAASGLNDLTSDEIADLLWADVSRALRISKPPVAVRVIKEKRATLLHSPETELRRPACRQGKNFLLAGDWTATGLPCTIESAIRSGTVAAAEAVSMLRGRA